MVEVLVAASIAALVIGAVLYAFGTISGAALRGGRVDVTFADPNLHQALYGTSSAYVTVWPNPNYHQAAQARLLRDRLIEDASSAVAVFALGRNGFGGVRPASINVPANTDLRTNATPETFRDLLVTAGASGASVFADSQNGRIMTTNLTIFLVGGFESQTNNSLRMVATYEIDLVAASSPAGIFATVRRYATNALVPTDFYHAFYAEEANGADGFRPLAVFFGRPRADSFYDDFATNHPFTMTWWPDPMVSRLSGAAIPADPTASDPPRAGYNNMAGRTSLFTVLPAFPGQ